MISPLNMIRLLLIFFFTAESLSAQFIIAGTPASIYHDIIPDTSMHGNSGGGSNSYSIDVNGDGAFDVSLTATFFSSPGGQDYASSADALNSATSLLFLRRDSCYISYYSTWLYTDLLKPFSLNDTVHGGAYVSAGYMSRYEQKASTQCLENGWSGQGDNYLGVRYQDSTGVYFGWVRIEVTSYSTFVVKEYSMNKPASQGIETPEETDERISVYPNPGSGYLIIHADGADEKKISFMAADGRAIDLPKQGDQYEISQLPPGIYILQIRSAKRILTKKIIKD